MPTQSGHSRGQKLERCNVLPRLVGHEPQTGGPTSDGDGLVLPTWAKVSLFKDTDVTQLMETALVRRTYAGWCGWTVAKATSYPISTERRRGTKSPVGTQCFLGGRLNFSKDMTVLIVMERKNGLVNLMIVPRD